MTTLATPPTASTAAPDRRSRAATATAGSSTIVGSDATAAPDAPPAPEAELLTDTIRLSLRLRRHGGDLESATGLAGRELDLVSLLREHGPTSVKSLVADLGTPRSTMTAIVDRLEERGLVRRLPNPEDRRSIVLEATPRAAEALATYHHGIARLLERVERILDPQERAELGRLLRRLATSL